MYCVLRAELLVYLTKIIQGLVACCVLCGLRNEPLMYLANIIQGLVHIVYCVLGAELI